MNQQRLLMSLFALRQYQRTMRICAATITSTKFSLTNNKYTHYYDKRNSKALHELKLAMASCWTSLDRNISWINWNLRDGMQLMLQT